MVAASCFHGVQAGGAQPVARSFFVQSCTAGASPGRE
jgi:hypothetical protein